MPDLRERVKTIFGKVLEIHSDDERSKYLDQACAGDVSLRSELDDLLGAIERAGNFLGGSPPAIPTIDQPITEKPGETIGPYKLLQQIGEGGMGVVFMAEQAEPLQRTVALKIIKPGMDTRQVIARFEAERQALALMDHPNIARVLDVGATDTGRPYFVMDLVKGVPITDYCDQQHLPVRQRLELVSAVCHAVQHAHQKGIIHRDLKPSNVLVAEYDGKPVPKIIDFGVAKATASKLTEKTMFTELGQLVGTVEYMSPEQARFNQLDVDTRSDVYSLGVLVYELLTGSTPFGRKQLNEAAFDEMLRIIREEEPPKPSTRLSSSDALPSIAANRSLEPLKLNRLLQGELDWIVMKALDKDRNRRYETASGLAADIQRHLNDEAVHACPPSLPYRLRKFVRRRKIALTTGTLVVAILSTFAGSAGWAVRDRLTRQAAVEGRALLALEDVKTAYQDDKLTDAIAAIKQAEGLLGSEGGNAALGERVVQWRRDLELASRLDEIRIERAGMAGQHTNEHGGARAVTAELGVDDDTVGGEFDYLRTDAAYSEVFRDQGWNLKSDNPDALAARMKQSLIRERLVAALDDWAITRKHTDPANWTQLLIVADRVDDDSWRARLRKAVLDNPADLFELADADAVRDQPVTSVILLARMLVDLQESDLAVNMLRAAHGPNSGDFWLNHELGVLLLTLDRRQPVDALSYLRAAVALRPQSPVVRRNLGEALTTMNRFAEAAEEYRMAESLRPRPNLARVHHRLGRNYISRGANDKAEAEFRAAVQMEPENALHHRHLALALRSQHKYTAEAEAEARAAIRLKPDYAEAHYDLGRILEYHGKLDEAEAEYLTALRVTPPGATGTLRNGARMMQGVLWKRGKLADAEEFWRERLTEAPHHPSVREHLAQTLVIQGKYAEAESVYRQADASRLEEPRRLYRLGDILSRQGKLAEAERVLRESLRIHPSQWETRLLLAQVLFKLGKRAEAEALQRQVIVARDPAAGANLVDLSRFYNAGLSENWHATGQLSNSFHALPQGIQTFDKVQFDVRGLIQIAGGFVCNRNCPWYPQQVFGLEINHRYGRVHFLHATVASAEFGAQVGTYIVHYADGQTRDIPIVYGENIGNWSYIHRPSAEASRATLAWEFADEYANSFGSGIGLYKSTWENLRPDVEIESIDFTTTMTKAAPFLVAITGEP